MRAAVLLGGFVLAASLALAAPARGANVSATLIDEFVDDHCGFVGEQVYEVSYRADPGEVNVVQLTVTEPVREPVIFPPAPSCRMTPSAALITELAAPITTSGEVCTGLPRGAVLCSGDLIWRALVETGDGPDEITLGPENPPATVRAGAGDDIVVNAGDGSENRISCGGGSDTAIVGPFDHVESDCEQVTRLG